MSGFARWMHAYNIEMKGEEEEEKKANIIPVSFMQWGFAGVSTFAHLNHVKCLTNPDTLFDIGIIGVPYVFLLPSIRFLLYFSSC